MLLSEHRGRRQHQRLLPPDHDDERRPDGDLGLPEAHVAADEPIHGLDGLEILLHRFDRPLLVGGLVIREARLELLDEIVVDVVGNTLRPLAARIERQELSGELAGAIARA